MACHKVILRARSLVFNAMFVHNMTESQEKNIDIEDQGIETDIDTDIDGQGHAQIHLRW